MYELWREGYAGPGHSQWGTMANNERALWIETYCFARDAGRKEAEAELAAAKGRVEALERRSVSEETLRKLADAMNDWAQKKRYSPHYNWHEGAKAELCEAAKMMLDSSTPGGVLQGESKPEKIG